MAWKAQRSSSCDLVADCFTNRQSKVGARNLFDEMPVSDWRSPTRVLDVSIHRVRYPVTEKVLRQVFGRYGKLEEVQLLGGLVVLTARVVFQSRHDAVEAFGSLHGRNIYDACCQLDIQFGAFQELEAAADTGRCDTMARSSARRHASPAPTMAEETVISCDITAVVSQANVATPSDTDAEARAICSTECQLSDVGVHVAAVVSVAATTISTTAALPEVRTMSVTVLRSSDAAHSDMDEDAHTNCSNKGTYSDNGIPASTDRPDRLGAALTSPQTPTLLGKPTLSLTLLSSLSLVHANMGGRQVFDGMLLSANVEGAIDADFLDGMGDNLATYSSYTYFSPKRMPDGVVVLWPMSNMYGEWQPWPPPIQLEILCNGADLRPMPWPSFNCHQLGVLCCIAELDHTVICNWKRRLGELELMPLGPPPSISVVQQKPAEVFAVFFSLGGFTSVGMVEYWTPTRFWLGLVINVGQIYMEHEKGMRNLAYIRMAQLQCDMILVYLIHGTYVSRTVQCLDKHAVTLQWPDLILFKQQKCGKGFLICRVVVFQLQSNIIDGFMYVTGAIKIDSLDPLLTATSGSTVILWSAISVVLLRLESVEDNLLVDPLDKAPVNGSEYYWLAGCFSQQNVVNMSSPLLSMVVQPSIQSYHLPGFPEPMDTDPLVESTHSFSVSSEEMLNLQFDPTIFKVSQNYGQFCIELLMYSDGGSRLAFGLEKQWITWDPGGVLLNLQNWGAWQEHTALLKHGGTETNGCYFPTQQHSILRLPTVARAVIAEKSYCKVQRVHGSTVPCFVVLHTEKWLLGNGCCSVQEAIYLVGYGRFMEFNTDWPIVWDSGKAKYIMEVLWHQLMGCINGSPLLWDPCRVLFILKVLQYRFEGKPNLKKGGMSGAIMERLLFGPSTAWMGHGPWYPVSLAWTTYATTAQRDEHRTNEPETELAPVLLPLRLPLPPLAPCSSSPSRTF
ncbi:hypothetical protein ACP70R_028623 [Stipagrostis hirtigluma subsp. patula]